MNTKLKENFRGKVVNKALTCTPCPAVTRHLLGYSST